MPLPDNSYLYQLNEIPNTVDALTAHFDIFRTDVSSTPYYILRDNKKLPIFQFHVAILSDDADLSVYEGFEIRKHSNGKNVITVAQLHEYNEEINGYQTYPASILSTDRVFFTLSTKTVLSAEPTRKYFLLKGKSYFNYEKETNIYNLSAYANNIPALDGTRFVDKVPIERMRSTKASPYRDTEESKNLIKFHLNNKLNEVNNITDIEYGTKNLLYYTIFKCSSAFIDILDLSLNSIHNTTPDKNFDVLFVTDELTKTSLESLSVLQFFNTKFMVGENISDEVVASIQKLKIYEFSELNDYNKILFLDADTASIKNINTIFTQELSSNVLDVSILTGGNPMSSVHSLKWFDQSELQYILDTKIRPFNAGQYMFKNSLKMQKHFENVYWLYCVWPSQFFYEQSFLNYYFNIVAKNSYSGAVNKYITLLRASGITADTAIVHFIGKRYPADKLIEMKEFLDNNT